MIPTSRSEVTGPLSWLLWAFFGNDDGGLYGERDHFHAEYVQKGPSIGLAVRWWLRNPMANLCKVVLAWPREDGIRELVDWAPGQGWTFFKLRRQVKWIGDGPQFTIAYLPPGIFWRNLLGTEGYWGWHDSGWLCILPTLRRTHDK